MYSFLSLICYGRFVEFRFTKVEFSGIAAIKKDAAEMDDCNPLLTDVGVKVTVATTHKEGLVAGMRSLPDNPYDGHTLPEAIEQVSILTDRMPKAVFVDKGYRGVSVDGVAIWRSGQKRGVTPTIRKAIRQRSAIEPAIGHMKNDGKLRCNWLKGCLGDAINAVLYGAGHNLRMILRAIRLCYAWIWGIVMANFDQQQSLSATLVRLAMR